MLSITSRIKNLLSNIKYLTKISLSNNETEQMYQTLLRVEDFYLYELSETDFVNHEKLQVLDYDKTVQLMIDCPKSFCRFGDGEIDLIQGKDIPFQKYEEKLSDILLTLLSSNIPDIYIGINYNYFNSTKNLNEFNRKFYLTSVKPYRDFLNNICFRERTYIAAGFNQLYMIMKEYDYDKYYGNIIKLFKGREIVVFAGKGIIDHLRYNIFEYSKSCEYEEGSIKNAFSEYEELIERSKKYPKSKTLCYILGPTSKALVYQLTQEGYMAWDIGHLAKDYDTYCQKVKRSPENIKKFFEPD